MHADSVRPNEDAPEADDDLYALYDRAAKAIVAEALRVQDLALRHFRAPAADAAAPLGDGDEPGEGEDPGSGDADAQAAAVVAAALRVQDEALRHFRTRAANAAPPADAACLALSADQADPAVRVLAAATALVQTAGSLQGLIQRQRADVLAVTQALRGLAGPLDLAANAQMPPPDSAADAIGAAMANRDVIMRSLEERRQEVFKLMEAQRREALAAQARGTEST